MPTKWKRVDERREHGVSGSNQESEGHGIGGGRPSPTGGEGSVVGNTREERGAGIMGDPGRMKNGEVRGTGDRSPRTRPGGAARLPKHLVSIHTGPGDSVLFIPGRGIGAPFCARGCQLCCPVQHFRASAVRGGPNPLALPIESTSGRVRRFRGVRENLGGNRARGLLGRGRPLLAPPGFAGGSLWGPERDLAVLGTPKSSLEGVSQLQKGRFYSREPRRA